MHSILRAAITAALLSPAILTAQSRTRTAPRDTARTRAPSVAPAAKPRVIAPDTTHDDGDDTPDAEPRLAFGVAAGSLSYDAGRAEQSLGAVLHLRPVPWFTLGATPTYVRASEPAIAPSTTSASRSGLTDLPIEATLAHALWSRYSVSGAASLGVTLPVGDTATGLGSGEVGYSVSGGLGFSPSPKLWVHLGAGRSLTRFSVQSAFSSGTGWGDASAGYSLTDRLGISGGMSSDLGGVDSTLGRSRSVEGGLSYALHGHTSMNLSGSHGVSGSAPKWSFVLGVGSAFPYLNHVGGASVAETLQQSFGGGTHGLSNGNGNGNSGTKTTGKGHGRSGP